MPETVTNQKGYDQIAAEAAQHAEESARELKRKADEIDQNTSHNSGIFRRRAEISGLAAYHARKCADEARAAMQSGNTSLAAKHAREALADAQQAGEAARIII